MSLSQTFRFNPSYKAKNRVALAPMTNTQSESDGTASSEEVSWLERRAEGGFGMTITCASHVLRLGQGWPGQMGIFSDALLPGLKKVAAGIRKHGCLGLVQLHHGGVRALKSLTGKVPNSVIALPQNSIFPDGATALSIAEIDQVIEAFILAAKRAEQAGFAGVELHGAHGYLLSQFFDRHLNTRQDEWGGPFEDRIRIWIEIIHGIKKQCGPDFILGVRFSPENYGSDGLYPLEESFELMDILIDEGVDLLHASLWDVFKTPADPTVHYPTTLDALVKHVNGRRPLMVAGKIWTLKDAGWAMDHGADFVALGKVAIANPDWPKQLIGQPLKLNVPPYDTNLLERQQLGPAFINYLRRWPGFIQDEPKS